MPITTNLYKGKEELTMAQYEALSSVDTNIDYNLTDHPDVGITNSQMAFALTCARLFQEDETYTCIDDGTYTSGHIYKIVVNEGVKSWSDITPSGGGGLEVLTGTTDPTTSTVGSVGQFYLNTNNKKLFQCTEITTAEGVSTYTWQAVGGGMEVLTGDSAPTTSTVGEVGQLYKYVHSGSTHNASKLCICLGNSNNKYQWVDFADMFYNNSNGSPIEYSYYAGGAYSQVGVYSTGEYNVGIGGGAQALKGYGVAIGNASSSNAQYCTAIGSYSTANSQYGVAVGYNAVSQGDNAIQIGQGNNSTANTFQVRDDNIYKTNTHILTVQNIKQGTTTAGAGGYDVYGVIKGTTDPDSTVTGETGQHYINTTSGKEFYYNGTEWKSAGSSQASSVSYLTTAPTEDNTDGLKFVVLDAEPATRYNGYYYIITEA